MVVAMESSRLEWSAEVKSRSNVKGCSEMEMAVVGLKRWNYVMSHCDCFFVCVRLNQD
jgi:hypothetical protein